MINGITIGDRHFEFLAFGNSQFREHGAYFFSPVEHLGTMEIRKWMGDFKDIRTVAKYAARLGMCFSTTRAIHNPIEIVETDQDVVIGDYNFTDGVGKMSRFLAVVAAHEVGFTCQGNDPPSVFQFRLGGCKGVLAVCPELKPGVIHIRQSQYKFPAIHSGLEIIRWAQFTAAHLNRQLIMVLSGLGVPDRVILERLTQQLSNLERAMVDEKIALAILTREIDPNQMTLAIASMVLDGFQSAKEPFMLSLLKLWRAWSIKYPKALFSWGVPMKPRHSKATSTLPKQNTNKCLNRSGLSLSRRYLCNFPRVHQTDLRSSQDRWPWPETRLSILETLELCEELTCLNSTISKML